MEGYIILHCLPGKTKFMLCFHVSLAYVYATAPPPYLLRQIVYVVQCRCPPECLQVRVLGQRGLNALLFTGHLGRSKCMRRLRSIFYFRLFGSFFPEILIGFTFKILNDALR